MIVLFKGDFSDREKKELVALKDKAQAMSNVRGNEFLIENTPDDVFFTIIPSATGDHWIMLFQRLPTKIAPLLMEDGLIGGPN